MTKYVWLKYLQNLRYKILSDVKFELLLIFSMKKKVNPPDLFININTPDNFCDSNLSYILSTPASIYTTKLLVIVTVLSWILFLNQDHPLRFGQRPPGTQSSPQLLFRSNSIWYTAISLTILLLQETNYTVTPSHISLSDNKAANRKGKSDLLLLFW